MPVNGNSDALADAGVGVSVGPLSVCVNVDKLHRLGVEQGPPYADVAGDAAMATGTRTSANAQIIATDAVAACFTDTPRNSVDHAPVHLRWPPLYHRRQRPADVQLLAPSPWTIASRTLSCSSLVMCG